MSDRSRPRRGTPALTWLDGVDPGLVRHVATLARGTADRAIVVHDHDGPIVAGNGDAADLLGLTLGQLLGRTSRDERWQAVSELGVSLPGDQHPAMQSLLTGVPVERFIMGVHVPEAVVDGVEHLAENRWLEIDSVPVVVDGTTLGAVAWFRDVSDSERGREASSRLLDAYRVLAINATDVLIRSDKDGLVSWVSPAAKPILGWEPSELVGRRTADLVHPDDVPRVRALQDQVMNHGQSSGHIELRISAADGTWVWMSDLGRALFDQDGRRIGAIDALRDIREEVANRELLRRSEERFRLLAENASDVVTQSRDGVIQWVSPSLTAALGWSPGEWIGRPWTDFTHLSDADNVEQQRIETLAGGHPITRLRLRAVDGTHHWVERISGQILDTGGADGVITGSFRVIDDVVEAERRLRDSEEHYRLLAENATDVIAHIRGGRIVWVSPSIEAALGGRPEDWIGLDVVEVLDGDELPRRWEGLAVQGEPLVGVVRVQVKGADTTLHWVEANTGPFIDTDGTEDGVIASVRVVDDVVRVERELERRARFDTLTGLMNRNEVLQRLEAVSANARNPGEETAVLFCDIDFFKDINDTFGHAAGDAVLRTLSERIAASVRAQDVAGRMGGDEVLVMLTGIHSLDEAAAIAEKVRESASDSIAVANGHVTATLSIGVTLLRAGESVDDVVARADRAMYEAKQSGRDRVVAFP